MDPTSGTPVGRVRPDRIAPEWRFLLLVAVVALAVAAFALQLWRADLRVPLAYQGYAVFGAATFKGMTETGSWLTNPRIGTPGVADP